MKRHEYHQRMILILLTLLSVSLRAHVIQDDVAISDKNFFPFTEVCAKLVTHESPLIEAVSGTQLDCMGKKVEVRSFCEKVSAHDPYYLRAYVDKEKKNVVCVSGKKVIFKYLCVKLSDTQLCSSEASQSCRTVQAKLAKSLDLVHSSFVKNEKSIKQLNCFFEALPLKERSL